MSPHQIRRDVLSIKTLQLEKIATRKATTAEEATDFERQTRALQAAATITAAWVQRPDTNLDPLADGDQAEVIFSMLEELVQKIQSADDGTKFFK